MTLEPRLRWVLGLIGILLLGLAVGLAWLKPDGLTVVGFLTVGAILLVLGIVPKAPVKIGIGGNVLEFPESIVDAEYAEDIDRILRSYIAERWAVLSKNWPPETGSPGPVALANAREAAREAKTPAQFLYAIQLAKEAASDTAALVFQLIRAEDGQES